MPYAWIGYMLVTLVTLMNPKSGGGRWDAGGAVPMRSFFSGLKKVVTSVISVTLLLFDHN
jgi:hypothetical protein